MTRLAIFASGSGSNAEKIMEYFYYHEHINVDLLLSNNAEALALKRAENFGVHTLVFDKKQFAQTDEVLHVLLQHQINYIILAGFLWHIPHNLTHVFEDKIINIHPALLPKYGGKGMYGKKVHETVLSSGEKESGITIHLVNENYDEGKILFQEKVDIHEAETPETLAEKIHALEHNYYPMIIHKYIQDQGR